MSFSFKEIPENKVNATFQYKGQTLNAVIDANRMTQEMANTDDYALAISMFIESWDAVDSEPTLAFLRTLPMEFLIGFFMKCTRSAFPKATTAGQ